MDEVDEAALERWFRALETVPDGGRAITAALYALSDNAVLDLVREAPNSRTYPADGVGLLVSGRQRVVAVSGSNGDRRHSE